MQTSKYLAALFEPGEIIQVNGTHPAHVQYSGPWEGLTGSFDYIGLNALKAPLHRKSSASDMLKATNFLLEFDSVSLDAQRGLLFELRKVLPVRTETFSGNKSIHGIISLSDSLVTTQDPEAMASQYKAFAQGLIAAATAYLTPLCPEPIKGKLIDTANVDVCRLTRLGGGTNHHFKDPSAIPTPQELLNVGKLCTSEQFLSFVAAHRPEYRVTEIGPKKAVYTGSFAKTLELNSSLHGLRKVLRIPQGWAGQSGNHPNVLQYTLWAIDATGVSEQEFREYFMKHTAPFILSLGYEAWKLDDSIKGAYNLKRIRAR